MNMRRIIALLMFPYFIPLVALSVLACAYMLVTPYKASDSTGLTGSDILGLYFIGICIIIGGALQLIIGLPLNALIARVNCFAVRISISIASVIIPALLYVPVMIDTPSERWEDVMGMLFILAAFGLGAWFVASTLNRAKRSEQGGDSKTGS